MPVEHEPARQPTGLRVPAWVHSVLLLACAGLMAFSLVRNDGRTGALIALGAVGLVLCVGWLTKSRGR